MHLVQFICASTIQLAGLLCHIKLIFLPLSFNQSVPFTTQIVNRCNISFQDVYSSPCLSFHHQWQSTYFSQLCFTTSYLPKAQGIFYFLLYFLFINYFFSLLPLSHSLENYLLLSLFTTCCFCQMHANCLIKQLSEYIFKTQQIQFDYMRSFKMDWQIFS